MKEESIIQKKSYAFAIRVVKLYKYLSEEKREFILSKQFLRSGTSIGANVEEATGGQSKKDFYAKLNIAYKEARETNYWLRLMKDTGYLSKTEFDSIYNDSNEILKILGSIIKTLKTKQTPNF